MSKFTHAKVASVAGPKLSTIMLVLGIVFVGAVSAKTLSASPEHNVIQVSTPIVVDDGCGGLIAGRSCRIDAAIDAAVK